MSSEALRYSVAFDSVPHMTAEPVGILIQRARQRMRLTQPELAARLGVSRSAVANWERGVSYPLRNAGAIEEVLGITIPAAEAAPA